MNVAIDADSLIFKVTEGKMVSMSMFKEEGGDVGVKDYKEPLRPYKIRFKALVDDIVNEIAANYAGEIGKVKVFLSDPKNNFRYDIYPKYKSNRDSGSRSELFYRLRKWALKKYGYVKGIEADDAVSYYVLKKGYIGATEDKDMLKGIEGTWFNLRYTSRQIHTLLPHEARCFNLIQTLTGDPVDYIKALPDKAGTPMIPIEGLGKGVRQPLKVTEIKASKLLDEFGWDWEGVVKAFESKGFGEEEAILNHRLISMRQWSPKKGVRLFAPKKKTIKEKGNE